MQSTNKNLVPFLKWAGGKRQLLPEIRKYIPEYKIYFEPFVGAGAVLLDLQPMHAIVNDINSELINTYSVIKNSPQNLISQLETFATDDKTYYEIRAEDRNPEYINKSDVFKAARMIYLNRLCFNGLYRVNSKGYFNVPYGKYSNPLIVNRDLIMDLNVYFNEANIEFLNLSFEKSIEKAEKGDFIYFDPPYDPINATSSFTSYSLDAFGKDKQIELRDLYNKLSKKNIKVLLSNSSTPFIRELYKDFNIHTVEARRNINSKGLKRGKIDEVLITNY